MEMLLPQVGVPAEEDKSKQLSRRLQEALQPGRGEAPEEKDEPPEVEVEATFTVSDREVLQHRDFEQMSQAEIDDAPARDLAAAPAGARAPYPPLSLGAARPAGRLPRLAAPGAPARGPDRAAQARAAPPAAAARHPVRHLGLDEPLQRACSCISCTPSPTTATASTASSSARGSPTSPARCATRTSTSPCRRRRPRSRTGRAARASARPCTSSTTSGRAGCWGRAPSCC